jgi:hypothetical protein
MEPYEKDMHVRRLVFEGKFLEAANFIAQNHTNEFDLRFLIKHALDYQKEKYEGVSKHATRSRKSE